MDDWKLVPAFCALVILMMLGASTVTTEGCSQPPAKTAQETKDVASLTLDAIECLETIDTQDESVAIAACLKDVTDPSLIDLGKQLFGQKKMAMKAGFAYRRIKSGDAGK